MSVPDSKDIAVVNLETPPAPAAAPPVTPPQGDYDPPELDADEGIEIILPQKEEKPVEPEAKEPEKPAEPKADDAKPTTPAVTSAPSAPSLKSKHPSFLVDRALELSDALKGTVTREMIENSTLDELNDYVVRAEQAYRNQPKPEAKAEPVEEKDEFAIDPEVEKAADPGLVKAAKAVPTLIKKIESLEAKLATQEKAEQARQQQDMVGTLNRVFMRLSKTSGEWTGSKDLADESEMACRMAILGNAGVDLSKPLPPEHVLDEMCSKAAKRLKYHRDPIPEPKQHGYQPVTNGEPRISEDKFKKAELEAPAGRKMAEKKSGKVDYAALESRWKELGIPLGDDEDGPTNLPD